MGMFDDIRCEHPLPGEPKPLTKDFQTKDFDCWLDQYEITSDGRVTKGGADVPFHGMLNFYHYDTKADMWYEYEAKFTDGRLVEIRPVSIYKNGVGGPQKVFYPPSESESGL